MDNKQTLSQANLAVENGDYEKFLSFCTDDIYWNFVGKRSISGKAAILEYMKKSYIQPPINTVKMIFSEGDYLAVSGKIAIVDDKGKWNESTYCDLWLFKNGKMTKLEAFVVDH